jgi:hypothetical protein
MSLVLWNKLPRGFLKKGFKGWDRLDYDVKLLIVELAEEQKFKCAHCNSERGLIVEHDHSPEFGGGDRYTIYNIRGLVCQRCNWHLMVYEKDRSGEYRGFDEVYSYISDQEYESYIYAYDCRVITLYEESLKERMGVLKYLRRRSFLDRFDDWEWRGHYPWHWEFDEIKDQKYGNIRTPLRFIKTLAACVQFVEGELENNPAYEPPEKFVEVIFRMKPLMDELRPVVEARLLVLGKANNAGA